MTDVILEPVVSVTHDLASVTGTAIALDAIDLKIPGQKMIGLIGPDGLGKSTLSSGRSPPVSARSSTAACGF